MVDLDVLFSYQTLKIVRIYDRKLGILHYIFQLIILAYIIGYTIIYQKRYLRTETPYGTVRATLQEPPKFIDAPTLPYCLQNQPFVVNSHGNFTNYQCVYLLGYDVTYPPAPQDSIFGTTRIKDTPLAVSSNCTNATTPYPASAACALVANPAAPTTSYYIGDIEDYTLFMEHAVYGKLNSVALTNTKLSGTISFPNGSTTVLEDYTRSGDIFTIKDMLYAAGVTTLDAPSGIGKNLRYDGIEIMVVATYDNAGYSTSKFEYSYSLAVISGVDSVAMQPSQGTVQSTRHGIKFVFIITGTIGVFDFQTLLQSIVSGVVLLKVASTIVDLLLIYVMPAKEAYKKHKYEDTEDFSEAHDLKILPPK